MRTAAIWCFFLIQVLLNLRYPSSEGSEVISQIVWAAVPSQPGLLSLTLSIWSYSTINLSLRLDLILLSPRPPRSRPSYTPPPRHRK